jgi:glycosyltransferase involved in cell wall biosynthesis
LDSVMAQTYSDWEVIVVDDGSEDGTIEMLESITDGRIRFIIRDCSSSGAPVCRNIGAAEARGELLIFLDSDDLLLPHALERRAEMMISNPSLNFACYVGEMFDSAPGDRKELWNIPTDRPDFDRFLEFDVSWQTTGPVWRADFFHRIGAWDETLICGQDSELHLRALSYHPEYRYCAEVDYAIRADNVARGSVGVKWMSVEGQLAHAQSVINLCASDRCFKLTKQQKAIAAGRLLYHAIHIIKIAPEDGRDMACTLWQNARRYRLISPTIYILGRILLRKFRGFRGDMAAYLIRHLESDDFMLSSRARIGTIPTSCLSEKPYDGRFHRQDPFVQSRVIKKGLSRYLLEKIRPNAAAALVV